MKQINIVPLYFAASLVFLKCKTKMEMYDPLGCVQQQKQSVPLSLKLVFSVVSCYSNNETLIGKTMASILVMFSSSTSFVQIMTKYNLCTTTYVAQWAKN